MDKWLAQDLEAFSRLMDKKGYTGPFLVNNSYSGELLAAVKVSEATAKEQGSALFPLILHTRIKTGDAADMPLLRLRLDDTDQGIQIRDATIETVKVNGITRYNVDVPFANTGKFPSNEELMEKVRKRFIKTNKTIKRGL
ncbi:MAG: hypothetical protein J0I32_20165 [Sphingobacteriales bacterium]|nr:hypothetical protein [Sphingobacteriales bacterium]OJV98824.1 MAG: hypothetical protein BGO52_08630 [Sphingobacteriales bacterium 44-61]